jgi:proliferating cell nuclear antigen
MTLLLQLRTVQSSCFRTLWEVLKEILTDVTLNFSSEGLRLNAIDGSRVSLVYLKLDACNFEEFYCPKPVAVGLNTLSVFRLLKSLTSSDCITWEIEAATPNLLKVLVENADKNFKTSYSLKLLDLDEEMLTIPDLTENVTIINLPSSEFQKFVRDMHVLSDIVTIKMSKELQLHLICEGDLASQITVLGESHSGLRITQKTDKKHVDQFEGDFIFEGRFSLRYLNLFVKSTNLSSSCELLLRTQYPLILRYSVASLGTINFCLAPRCE